LFPKEKKVRGPNKKKEVVDETTGKVFVAGLDSIFQQFGLEPLIEEKDKKYFSSVMSEGDTSFSKMYAKAFSGFFQKKFKEKIDDFEIFSFYVMTMALLVMKSNEAKAKGFFEKLSVWQKVKGKFSKKKGIEDETIPETTE
ncbi:hypothetical protein GOV14_03485, partial [Candidatus Pacearchaeota archaeon]|nr:hypothetical protein [Candidatus Pacearchaeota archaeon]